MGPLRAAGLEALAHTAGPDTPAGPTAGYVDPAAPFYQACDVIVSTSEYESFGNSVCEAMASGLAVAGYRGGAAQEVVGDAGLIVETGDLSGLTAAVKRVIGDPCLRRDLERRARERVTTHFDAARSVLELCRVHESVCR